MLTRSDLSGLATDSPPLGVSLFLPTEPQGAEIRQAPIRLKNLLAQVREALSASGVDTNDMDELLTPARELVDDYQFWQHQDEGLALFLGGDGMRSFAVPLSLSERVVVGSRFHLKPLLPLLTADGPFRVLTITAKQVKLYIGSRFTLSEDDTVPLPDDLAETAGESDYENPVQAPPVARPNTGAVNIGNAQVYGDSPPDWRKSQLVDFVHKVAGAVDTATASHRLPVVVVADAELGGHFRKSSELGPLLVDIIEANPDTFDRGQLHDATYQLMRPHLDERRQQAIEQFAILRGQQDSRAASQIVDVVKAAFRGQVDTMFLRMEPSVAGRYDATTDEVIVDGGAEETGTVSVVSSDSDDLCERAAMLTLEHGGDVHILEDADLPEVECGGALLRY